MFRAHSPSTAPALRDPSPLRPPARKTRSGRPCPASTRDVAAAPSAQQRCAHSGPAWPQPKLRRSQPPRRATTASQPPVSERSRVDPTDGGCLLVRPVRRRATRSSTT
eukprot:scaffold11550_cov108-Isochrysis_galbana.AAC.2